MKFEFVKGETGLILVVFINDNTATNGDGLAALDENSSITGGFVKRNGLGIALVVDEDVSTEGTYEAPTTVGQVRIGTPANMIVGTYELHFHNDLFTNEDYVTITLHGAIGMAPLTLEIQLTGLDPNAVVVPANLLEINGATLPVDNLISLVNAMVLSSSTIETVTSQTEFMIPATDDATDNDVYIGALAVFIDGTDPNQKSYRFVIDYTASSRTIEVHAAPDFTITTADTLTILLSTTNTAVWDRLLTGMTHNTPQSAGRRLRALSGLILAEGTAQSGGNDTIQLASGDVAFDGQFVSSKVLLVDGSGATQERIIADSVASTDTLTLSEDWASGQNPDNTTGYEVLPAQVHTATQNGGYVDAAVWYGPAGVSEAGSLKFRNATSTRPSNVIADLRTVADLLNLRRINLLPGSVLVLDQSYINFQFGGENGAIILNDKDISGSTFARQGILGNAIGSVNCTFKECGIIGPVQLPSCAILDCGLVGAELKLIAGDSYAVDNSSQGNTGAVIINVNGDGILTTTLIVTHFSGDLLIKGMTANDVVIVYGEGTVEFDSSNTGGSISLGGNLGLTDDSTGTTITEVSRFEITRILSDSVAFAGADIASIKADTIKIDDLAIKKNTVFSNFEFLMVLTSDHVTPATALIVTGQRSIDGGAFANVAGTIGEVSNGIYQFDALAADTNGDVITWRFSSGTADDTFVTFKTVS